MTKRKRLAVAACGIGMLLAVGEISVRAMRLPQTKSAVETCGVGLAGTTFLLRQTGPHARAHCAANVKRSKPLGAYWSTQTGTGLVLVCQVRYKDGILDQVYAASRDDFFAQTDCSVLADDVNKGKARSIPLRAH